MWLPTSNGMEVRVKVISDAKKEKVFKESEHHFAISIKEPAERNMANKQVIEIVAPEYGVLTSQVRILTGHHRPNKLLLIDE